MDPGLLARLPDAAKLGILRHLGVVGSSSCENQQQQQQQDVPPTPGGTAVPALLAARRLTGGLAIADGFLSDAEVKAAQAEAHEVLGGSARSAGMVSAQEGAAWKSSTMRGDQAAWLSAASLEACGHRCLAAAVQRLLSLAPWLQRQGFDVGGRASVQLARYPGGGARYVRHRDASASVPYRSVTAILYLNPGWTAAHGGQLCVYNCSTTGADPTTATLADLRLAAAQPGSSSPHSSRGSSSGSRQTAASSPASNGSAAAVTEHTAVCSGLDEGHPATVVAPLGGRLLVMDSRLLHEVLPAHADRYALTVWFSQTPPAREAAAAVEVPDKNAQVMAAPDEAKRGMQELSLHDAAACAAEAAAKQELSASPLPAQQQQQQAGASPPPLSSAAITAPGCIFVSVPAYRDSEAQWTLADLFAKATHPERIRVGIVWQVHLPADAPMMRLAGDQRWLGQVRQVVLPASEATGPCKARALAQQLWAGEEFHLQIDSHMRFVRGWDEALLRMLCQAEAAAGHPRVVLSTYPPGYEGEGPDAVLPAAPLPTVLCASGWGERDGLLRITGRKLGEPLAAPVPALFWAAAPSFSRSQLILEAPYPRDLPWLFFGEEPLQLVRMWRRGWDVFTPCQAVAFHLWERKHRPTFQQDLAVDAAQRLRSQQRVIAALSAGEEEQPVEGAAGIASSTLGSNTQLCRSLQQFWAHCGVNFAARTISERARNGGLPPHALLKLSIDALV